jgi:two-component system invasion response regulator UvrY
MIRLTCRRLSYKITHLLPGAPIPMNHQGCPTSNVRILVVDDHFVVREGLKSILLERYASAHFGDAANEQETLEKVWNEPWDVVLLDINLPGRNGLEVMRELKKAKPKLPVIILSVYPEDQFAIRALKLGAASYIRKDSAGSELVQGVEAVLNGGKYITPSVAEKLATHLEQDGIGAPHESLSDREYQVMCLLGSGKTVKEIGSKLSLSVKTISTYRTRILEKMSMRHNAELMRYVMANGLIETEG